MTAWCLSSSGLASAVCTKLILSQKRRLGLSIQIQILYNDWHISLTNNLSRKHWRTVLNNLKTLERDAVQAGTYLRPVLQLFGKKLPIVKSVGTTSSKWWGVTVKFWILNETDANVLQIFFCLFWIPGERNELSVVVGVHDVQQTRSKNFRENFFAPSHPLKLFLRKNATLFEYKCSKFETTSRIFCAKLETVRKLMKIETNLKKIEQNCSKYSG